MKTLRVVPILFVTLSALAGCDRGVELETRTFRLESLRPDQAADIVQPYVYSDRTEDPGVMTVTVGALTVRETEDNLERIARVLEEFDRPVGELRLRFQVIEANGAAVSDPAIAEVEEELRVLFRFEGYRLVGEGVVSVASGSEFQDRLLGSGTEWLVSGRVYEGGGETVRLDGVRLWQGAHDNLIETSVNIRPGQTIVLGSARGRDQAGAVILVVKAERTP